MHRSPTAGARRIAAPLLLGLAAALTAACITIGDSDSVSIDASGVDVTREYSLDGFDAVEAEGAFDVTVAHADGFAVTVTIDELLLDELEVEVRDDTLRLGFRSGISFRGSPTIEARVTMPALRAVELSGASRALVAGFPEIRAFDADLSGASRLEGTLQAGDLTLHLSGASQATVSGSARFADLDASGASRFALESLEIEEAAVHLSGASHADILVTGTIAAADLSGASTLRYAGDPAVRGIETSGGSRIEAR